MYEVSFRDKTFTVKQRRYAQPYMGGSLNALALVLVDPDSEEVYGNASVFIMDAFLEDPDYDVAIDINNMTDSIVSALSDAHVIEEEPYTEVRSGFVLYPIFKLTDEFKTWVQDNEDINE